MSRKPAMRITLILTALLVVVPMSWAGEGPAINSDSIWRGLLEQALSAIELSYEYLAGLSDNLDSEEASDRIVQERVAEKVVVDESAPTQAASRDSENGNNQAEVLGGIDPWG